VRFFLLETFSTLFLCIKSISSFIAHQNHILAPFSKAIAIISTPFSPGFPKTLITCHSGFLHSHFIISIATNSPFFAFFDFDHLIKKSCLNSELFGTTNPNVLLSLYTHTIGSFLLSMIFLIIASSLPLKTLVSA